jgi:hypothetical protein
MTQLQLIAVGSIKLWYKINTEEKSIRERRAMHDELYSNNLKVTPTEAIYTREGTSDMDLNGLLKWLKQRIISPVYQKLKDVNAHLAFVSQPFNHLVQNGFTDGSRLWWCPMYMRTKS